MFSTTILSIILLSTTSYLCYSKFIYGDPKEREEILSATIYHLTEQKYSKEDIIEIDTEYNAFKGGLDPYGVRVVTKDNPKEVKLFGWNDKNKTKIVQVGRASR